MLPRSLPNPCPQHGTGEPRCTGRIPTHVGTGEPVLLSLSPTANLVGKERGHVNYTMDNSVSEPEPKLPRLMRSRVKRMLFGAPRDLHDPTIGHKISLIAFLA